MPQNWDEYLMGFAEHAATQSKDTTQVGAVLVGPEREVLATGFNGPPKGVRDTAERFVRPTKYLYASHAEANLIAFSARHGVRTAGCTVYVTHMPCSACARTLIQAGITKVVVGGGETSMPYEEFSAAEKMFAEAGVEVIATTEPKVPEKPLFEVISIPNEFKTPKEAYQLSRALLDRANRLRETGDDLYRRAQD